jgi:hypothetical protein
VVGLVGFGEGKELRSVDAANLVGH